ncbi:rubredoxin [hydrocarbon metagenome]|uniref:ferredoxin:thioredoxin reductase n=1 Tax=hydrocarbon metagenome TaxID=938273 RepID=A0A0W8FGG6_9ZZZZ|nr:ferredoxin-thioredoxin reductase catalytic domain-containing protein [Methanomicrobiaceae archaeon]
MNDDEEKAIEELRSRLKKYARERGWVLNPDEKKLRVVLRGLIRNKARFGELYCPCRLRSGDPEKDRIIICPCIYHEDEIAQQDRCHCNLFFRSKTE